MDRTSFYEWKRRFQPQCFEGLKDLRPVHKSYPMTTPPEVVARIHELALEHPAYGCNRLEAMLALRDRGVSAITIQTILNEAGLGTKYERWLKLEEKNAAAPIAITPEQAAFIRLDNGSEFVTQAVRDWIDAFGAKTACIEPGSPWGESVKQSIQWIDCRSNGSVESFNARLRDQRLDRAILYTLKEAQILIECWRRHHTHSGRTRRSDIDRRRAKRCCHIRSCRLT